MSVIHLTNENFEQEVINSSTPVLVDFWAPWCGPCKMLSPVIDELASEISDVKICKVNIDEQPEIAKQFRVMSIPTLVKFESGKAAKRSVGFIPKEEIITFIK